MGWSNGSEGLPTKPNQTKPGSPTKPNQPMNNQANKIAKQPSKPDQGWFAARWLVCSVCRQVRVVCSAFVGLLLVGVINLLLVGWFDYWSVGWLFVVSLLAISVCCPLPVEPVVKLVEAFTVRPMSTHPINKQTTFTHNATARSTHIALLPWPSTSSDRWQMPVHGHLQYHAN